MGQSSGVAVTTVSVACVTPKLTLFAGNMGGSGMVDGTGAVARFSYPYGAATDSAGNVYVADTNNDIVRKITPSGDVSTFAGSRTGGSADGTGGAAGFTGPMGVATDSAGNVYVTDNGNTTVRKITPGGEIGRAHG
jgi:hypothetical protein